MFGLFAYDNDGHCIGVNQTAKELFDADSDIYKIAEQYLADWREEYSGNLSNIMEAERKRVCRKDIVRAGRHL